MTQPVKRSKVAGALVIVAAFVTTNTLGILYANHVSTQDRIRAEHNAAVATRQQTQLFCTLMKTLDGAYQATPPTTETGKNVAKEVHQLVIGLGCE
jgi:hypothetical protein